MRIFIVTSDKTAWLLRACLFLLDKYWPEHPAVVVGGYTSPAFDLPDYATFQQIGEFKDYPYNRWSDGVLKFLEAQPDEAFCWTMDDFWLVRPVDDQAVRLLYDHLLSDPYLARIDLTTDRLYAGTACAAGQVGHVHLVNTPPSTPYQLSFQTGLWKRAPLMQYLKPGETAAESEIRGSHRMTLANASVIGTVEAPFRYLIAMQHGKLCIDGGGYQVPRVDLDPADKAELAVLGYLAAPEGVPA